MKKKDNNITYVAILSVFSFLIFSKNPMVLFPAVFFLLSLYFPVEKIKILGIIAAIAGIFLFLSYLPRSLSEAAGIFLSFLIVAEYARKGSHLWREWVHISSLLLMADSAIYGLSFLYFLLSFLFLVFSLWELYQRLYPAGSRNILKFLPVHLIAILLLTPIIFLSIPRKSTFFISGGGQRASGLADFVDLNFSGKIRESTAVAMEIEGQNIPVYWKAKVFYIYRNGKWMSEERGRVKGGKETVNLPETSYILKIKYILKYPRLIPFPYGTSDIVVHENAYWTHGDYFEFGGSIRRYKILWSPKKSSTILFVRPLYDRTFRLLGKENPEKYKEAMIYIPAKEWKKISAMAEKLRGSTLKETLQNIENFLNENYTYTTRIELLESEPVYNFLFVTRKGHCELFATASAVLLNSLGWNVRYVSGFRIREKGDDWAIARMRDAHAWVEVWNGKSWIPFDPSPGKITEEEIGTNVFFSLWGRVNDIWVKYVVGFSSTYQASAFHWLKKNYRRMISLIIFAILICIFIKLLLPESEERKRYSGYARKYPWYYKKLLWLAKRASLRKPHFYTPLEFGRLMGIEGEEIVKFYYRERFGKIPPSEEEIQKIKEELKKIENRLKGIER